MWSRRATKISIDASLCLDCLPLPASRGASRDSDKKKRAASLFQLLQSLSNFASMLLSRRRYSREQKKSSTIFFFAPAEQRRRVGAHWQSLRAIGGSGTSFFSTPT